MPKERYTKSVCIDAIKAFHAEHNTTSMAEYDRVGWVPSSSLIRKKYGSWFTALKDADLLSEGAESEISFADVIQQGKERREKRRQELTPIIASHFSKDESLRAYKVYANTRLEPNIHVIAYVFGTWSIMLNYVNRFQDGEKFNIRSEQNEAN